MTNNKKIIVLGITGLLGHKLFHEFSFKTNKIYGTTSKNHKSLKFFLPEKKSNVFYNFDVKSNDDFDSLFKLIKPDYVINCIAITSVMENKENLMESIEINSYLPLRLKNFSIKYKFNLIHFSTDSVYDDECQNKTEESRLVSNDLYTSTKILGEIECENIITLRTSIIGHTLKNNKKGLLDWFLSSKKTIHGHSKFIWSGITSLELFNVIDKFIICQNFRGGIYNLSSNPISKFELLNKISKIYKHCLKIKENDELKIDRSLNSNFFKKNMVIYH